ncbi:MULTISPECIES: DUF3710 domain-containing protein [unclassified Nocardioides]|uniref:DUF3710 domain-containing protein n=1 Tax=unclassified Nocardioides TaxID=2615069 RepID=UPI0009EF8D66|nr:MULTISPECIES: DUF3710 domain-containing protein [unclassified Nocardioides]GAW52191.1 uncharacterized protein PD653B2_4541 [Nocardioides sp. PD653-B2]GAW57500.1 uncharacterized protein PD653_4945 [Nocardioides sp. PD653]
MKFRRKSAEPAESEAAAADAAEVEPVTGPYDVDDLPADDEVQRLDLGSLLIEPVADLEVRLQVEEGSEEVQAVVLAGAEGAIELRAFAAPRGGDLWSDVRPKIAADYAQRGGTATEREGRFGTELVCALTVTAPDGRTGTQPSRVIGVNGERWMLRATLLGRPAAEIDAAGAWEDAIERIVVRRGTHAMPVGAELPLTLPPQDQLIHHTDA